MAMPTSAWASAGASLTPSPTIATRAPPACSARDGVRLVRGQHLGEHLVDAECAGDRARDRSCVAGDHRHRAAPTLQRGDGLAGLRAAPRPRARARRATRAVDERRAATVWPCRAQPAASRQVRSGSRAALRQQPGPPTATRRPSTWPARRGPAAVRSRRPAQPRCRAPRRRATIARASGCSRVSLDRRRQRQQRVLGRRRRGGDGGHHRLALGEGAGLVEEHDVDLARPLERQAVLHQDARCARRAAVEIAITSGMASPRACGQAMTSTVTRARSAPRPACPATIQATSVIAAGAERDVEQERRGAVGEHLRARAATPAPPRPAA